MFVREIIFSDILVGGSKDVFIFEFNEFICVYDIFGVYIDFLYDIDFYKGFFKFREEWIEECWDMYILFSMSFYFVCECLVDEILDELCYGYLLWICWVMG